MNQYKISRYEKNRDHDGNLVSIFLAVTASNGTDSAYYEHFLTADEQASVIEDEANLKPILNDCFAQAELKMENYIATKPMPPIIATEVVKQSFQSIINTKDIIDSKIAILADIEEKKQIEINKNNLNIEESTKTEPIDKKSLK